MRLLEQWNQEVDALESNKLQLDACFARNPVL